MYRDEMLGLIEDYIKRNTNTEKEKKLLRNLLLDKETSFIVQWEDIDKADGDIGLAIKRTVAMLASGEKGHFASGIKGHFQSDLKGQS